MPFSSTEAPAGLLLHPRVRDCAVVRISMGYGGHALVAHVVADGKVEAADLGAFLAAPRAIARRTPRAFVPVRAVPRGEDGKVDPARLPRPVTGRRSYGKGGPTRTPPFAEHSDPGPERLTRGMLLLAVPVAVLAFVLTEVLWRHSTDTTGIPSPWWWLFPQR
ncbi:hypothetical protein [Actinocorallia herbida]|uniref:hypothetical protein n=1 Tax=Actinocorallia herbida TaxID=58109 RepID=UPI000F4AFD80|nr:hypothetical protein [Actinocorallia herbida]